MALPDWVEWSNSGVGVLGLILAAAAVFEASGAKQAATKAREGIRRHNAEVDFGSLARTAKELHTSVENGRYLEARLRTTDLRSDLSSAISAHTRLLGPLLFQFRERQLDLALIAEGLGQVARELSESERIRLLRMTGAILDSIASQSGVFRSGVEESSNG